MDYISANMEWPRQNIVSYLRKTPRRTRDTSIHKLRNKYDHTHMDGLTNAGNAYNQATPYWPHFECSHRYTSVRCKNVQGHSHKYCHWVLQLTTKSLPTHMGAKSKCFRPGASIRTRMNTTTVDHSPKPYTYALDTAAISDGWISLCRYRCRSTRYRHLWPKISAISICFLRALELLTYFIIALTTRSIMHSLAAFWISN